MIEKVLKMSTGDKTVVEKLVLDKDLNLIHMVFENNKGLAPHYSNAVLHMTILRGNLSLTLGEQDVVVYEKGDVVVIPYNTKMLVRNEHKDALELLVIKAPGGKHPVEYC